VRAAEDVGVPVGRVRVADGADREVDGEARDVARARRWSNVDGVRRVDEDRGADCSRDDGGRRDDPVRDGDAPADAGVDFGVESELIRRIGAGRVELLPPCVAGVGGVLGAAGVRARLFAGVGVAALRFGWLRLVPTAPSEARRFDCTSGSLANAWRTRLLAGVEAAALGFDWVLLVPIAPSVARRFNCASGSLAARASRSRAVSIVAADCEPSVVSDFRRAKRSVDVGAGGGVELAVSFGTERGNGRDELARVEPLEPRPPERVGRAAAHGSPYRDVPGVPGAVAGADDVDATLRIDRAELAEYVRLNSAVLSDGSFSSGDRGGDSDTAETTDTASNFS
jgi:hypothetical protein